MGVSARGKRIPICTILASSVATPPPASTSGLHRVCAPIPPNEKYVRH